MKQATVRQWRVAMGGLVGLALLTPVWPEPTVTLEPAAVKVALNQSFQVTIRVSGAADLYGAEVHLSYDPEALQASRPALGDLFGSGARTLLSAVDINLGRLDIAQGVLQNPVQGGGVLATLEFRALKAGETTIGVDFDSARNRETLLATRGATIPCTAAGATVRVSDVPQYVHVYLRGHNLVGLPLTFEDPAPSVVLREAPTTVRLYRYQGDRYLTLEDAGLEPFAPGRGYFLKLESDALLRFLGRLTDPTQAVTVALQPGWNMVANPFDVPLPLSAVRVGVEGGSTLPISDPANSLTATYLWGYRPGEGYSVVHASLPAAERELKAWQGYWIRALADCQLTFGPAAGAGRGGASQQGGASSRLQEPIIPLVAQAGGERDAALFGYSSDEGLRRLDLLKPPPLGPSVRIAFEEGTALDLRSPAEHRAVWEFTVETVGVEGEVSVSWPDLSGWPTDQALVLTDLESGQRQHLRTTARYLYRAAGPVRRFRLAALPRGRRLAISELTVSPRRGGGVHLGFQLDQEAQVGIVIGRLDGRTVCVLPPHAGVAGRNAVVWNGLDQTGRRVPSGVYVIRVTALTGDGRQATALRTVAIRP